MNQTQAFPTQYNAISTGFKSEADLIETIIRNIKVFIPTGSFVASKEITIGAGTVDIVLGKPKTKALVERLKSPSPIRGAEAVVLSHLYLRKPLRASTVASRTGLDEHVTIKSLDKLMEYGLCCKLDTGAFLRSEVTEQFTSLITVEGKLRSWKRALQQAARNRFFSNGAFVVLDAKHARPATEHLSLFRKYGVGLAIANVENDSVSLLCRSGQPPNSLSNLYLFLAREELTHRVAQKNALLSEDLDAKLH